jgi:hypothetical protein
MQKIRFVGLDVHKESIAVARPLPTQLPPLRVRPRIDAMLIAGPIDKRVVKSIDAGKRVGPSGTGPPAALARSYRAK